MSKNLEIWSRFENIDPKYTKPITGKAYRGTSPNPQYVIRCLTEIFGPVGIGFGWSVKAEGFERLGEEVLHWCRIEFWHTDKTKTFEQYGQTRTAYHTKSGVYMVDEDAPKKSLTDAIVKCASQIGIAANIFLGRWDDQKYVAEVNDEYREAERKAAGPSAADVAKADSMIEHVRSKGWKAGTGPKFTASLADLEKVSPESAARVRFEIDRLKEAEILYDM